MTDVVRLGRGGSDGATLNAAAQRTSAEWLLVTFGEDGTWEAPATDPGCGAVVPAGVPEWADPPRCAIRVAAWRAAGGAHEGVRAGTVADILLRIAAAGWTVETAGRERARTELTHWLVQRHPALRPVRLRAFAAALRGSAAQPPEPAEIAVLAEQFPELSQTFVLSELLALQATGHGVRVEARRRAGRRNPDTPPGLPASYMEDDGRAAKALALAWLVVTRPRRVAADLRARRRWEAEEAVTPLRLLAPLVRRLHRGGVRHLHVHFAAEFALDALRAGRLLGRPYSMTAHAYEIYQRPANLAEKLRAAAFSTSGCDYTVRDLRAIAGDRHAARVHRIVMGVDHVAFRRHTPYPGTSHVLAIGRLVEKKGFADLVAAAAELPAPARVTIVGEGPLREELVRLRDRLGASRVEFAGARSPTEVRELLETVDVLAMPCVVAADGDRDSMPVVVKEALAMEIPVVATDEVGLPEMVEPEWGRLVPPRDPQSLAAALGELLALDPSERAAMGRAGRAFVVEHCDVNREARRLLALIAGSG